MKLSDWKALVDTPRKAVCWLIVLVDLCTVVSIPLLNIGLTQAQLLVTHWPSYLLVIVSLLIAYLSYPKN